MKSSSRISAALTLAGIIILALPGIAAAGCLTPSQAQKAIASGSVMRLAVIARAVGGEIVNAQLCEAQGLLVYQLAVMRQGGQVENVVVDATSGQRLR